MIKSVSNNKVHDLYMLLRKYASNVNCITLKQISLYIIRSTVDFDVNYDCSITLNGSNENYEILLKDGRRITFSGDLDEVSFTVFKEEKGISMSTFVHETIPGNIDTTSVYSEVRIKDNGMFVLTFRPNHITDESLKFGSISYYNEDEVNWVYEISGLSDIERDFDLVAKNNLIYPFNEKVFFDIKLIDDVLEFDNFDGNLSDVLTRVDLLYDNAKSCFLNKLSKKKR